VRVRVDLAYDGGGFRGFARQPGQRTVQGTIEEALARLCGEPVATTAAGRTDAGVHADLQVIHADVAGEGRFVADLDRARQALDRMCGAEITVWRVRRVPATFDARFSAAGRRYRYRLCDAVAMNPRWRHDTWHVGDPRLDVTAMQAGGARLLGEHDFSSFCRRAGDQHLIRRVERLVVRRDAAGLVSVHIAGPAFCHQMVRSVVGCLLPVGRRERPADWVGDVLAARDRHAVGRVAPPHGLALVGVSY
jgi:tRNA pseudouridine38-40 synthase